MTYNNGGAAHEATRRASQDLTNSKFYDAIIKGPVDMERRLAGTRSFKAFCEFYGSEAFTLEWSPYHLEAIEKIEEVIVTSACYALAMPRGSGKSTLCHWAMIWGLLCGHVEYAIYIGATASASATRLSSIKTTLRFNELLYEDFPEIVGPIKYCEGEARKAGGQKWNGESTEIRWGSDKLLLPTLQGFVKASSWYKNVPFNFGGVLDFASLEGNMRGRSVELPSGKILRPQAAIVDDPQTRESAGSPAQVLKRSHILKGDIGYLGGPERPCGVMVPCTVVYEDDLAHRLLDHELNPEYRGSRSAMLPSMPGTGQKDEEEIMKLWEIDYDEKRRYDLLNGTRHATDFYLENQDTMDRGADASWPQRFSELAGEVSAVQAAMNLYLADEMSFMCEAQNEPMPLEDREQDPLTVDQLLERGINLKRYTCPSNTEFLTSFIDISRNVLWYATIAWEKETFKGHVVDYGVWPEQGKHYVTLATAKKTIPDLYPNDEYSVALSQAIDGCVGYILGCSYKTEGGNEIYPERVGIDSGWGEEAQTVYEYCRRSKQGRLLISTKGFGSTPARRPLVDPEKKREPNTSLIGQWKFSRNTVGSNLLQYDTNLWKTKVDSLLRLPNESQSGMTLFNAKERGRKVNHRMFAEQCTTERSIMIEGGGRRIQTWKNTPGRDNHFFDCVVGATMLGHVAGCKMQVKSAVITAVGGSNIKKTKAKRKRRRFVQGN